MIWIIGGTKDSRDFLEKAIKISNNIIVTTATEYGGKLLEGLDIKVASGKLTKEEMDIFVKENNVTKVFDLSHPYAYEVSKNVIETANANNVTYYRFEREDINVEPKRQVVFDTIEQLMDYVSKLNEKVLVTLGSNNIPFFKDLSNLNKFYFRILPKWEMVKRCEDIGVLPNNIIAMQGPFSAEMNIAMMDQLGVKYMISKKTGNTGGELEKIKACDARNVEMVYLDKPNLEYPNCYKDIDLLLKFVSE